jgi:phenylalanyl-tRNA synthetase beta chain
MRVSRNWLQEYFEAELPSAAQLAETLTFHAFEVEGVEQVGDDWVIDVDVLPNRSSDCLSHRGIAYELSVLLSLPMKKDPLREALAPLPVADTLRITLEKHQSCDRYIGAHMRGVSMAPSPAWLQNRLRAIGQRPINVVVDITNYVMCDLGQPMHAFDAAALTRDTQDTYHIGARVAKEGERITTLTGETCTLTPEDTVISDMTTDTPLAIAGVKGGAHAEVTPETTDIILEAAHFAYLPVRKTSRRVKIATESSLRFQNDPSALLPEYAIRKAIRLIEEIAGGSLAGVAEAGKNPPSQQPVDVTLSRINTLLGTALTTSDVEDILVRFGWTFSRDNEEFAISSPWERTDLHIEEEYIEEIGRVHGYSTLVGSLPPAPRRALEMHPQQYYVEALSRALSDIGYAEVYTYTLQNSGEVALENPLAADKSHLRSTLTHGMHDALAKNAYTAPVLGEYTTLTCFEIGTIWRGGKEHLSLAVGVRALAGKQSKAEAGLCEHVREVLTTIGANKVVLPPLENGVLEIDLSALIETLPRPTHYGMPLPCNMAARYTPWSVYPHVLRDIAVWVPEDFPNEEVAAIIIATAPETLLRHDLFDTFSKDGRTSYAWHLVFQSTERTLTDEEVSGTMEDIAAACTKRGWEVR